MYFKFSLLKRTHLRGLKYKVERKYLALRSKKIAGELRKMQSEKLHDFTVH
jgi:hypothetical protein